MKYALVNGERREAASALSGKCPDCDGLMVSKCGEVKIRHWAHHGKRNCDLWWENETEWHRAWKDKFPSDWQEVVHRAENGEKHIADVKTDQGWVLEFQHSFLKPGERRARDNFYPKLVWIVDGTRRKRDIPQFNNALKEAVQLKENIPVWRLRGFLDECALFREWSSTPIPIFFDFHEPQILWYLFPKTPDGNLYVSRFNRSYFLELFLGGAQKAPEIESWFKEIVKIASDFSQLQTRSQRQPSPLPSFQRYLFRNNSSRRRF